MGGYTVRRLLAIIPTIFLISLFVFFIMRIMPGDVARLVLAGPESNQAYTEEELQEVRDRLGLNDPIHQQYLNWVGDLFFEKGGDSLFSGEPVFDALGRRLPLTLELTIGSLLLGHLIAIPAGVFSALRRNSLMDHGVRFFAITGLAIPNFWLGIMVILLLVNAFDYSIPLGYVSPFEDPWKNFQQQIFPIMVLGTALSASVARLTRASMLETLREDFVRTAYAKGLRGRTVILRHTLRNSMLPVMTLSALQFGFLLSGTVVVERVFNLPGLGRYIVDAIFQRDYVVVQTIVLFFGVIYMLINLATDLAYAVVDPRIRYK